MIKVKINTEEELKEFAEEAIRIMVNLRYWTKRWSVEYGSMTKDKKVLWERKADELLQKMQSPEKFHGGSKVILTIQPENDSK